MNIYFLAHMNKTYRYPDVEYVRFVRDSIEYNIIRVIIRNLVLFDFDMSPDRKILNYIDLEYEEKQLIEPFIREEIHEVKFEELELIEPPSMCDLCNEE